MFFSAEKPSLYHPLKTEILSNQYLGNSFFRTSFCRLSVSAIIQLWTGKMFISILPFVLSHPRRSEFAADGFFTLFGAKHRLVKDRREQKCFCHIKNKPLFILRQYHILYIIIISYGRSTKKVNSNSLFCLSYISTFYKFRQKTGLPKWQTGVWELVFHIISVCQNNSLISWRSAFQFVTLAFRGRMLVYKIPDRFHFLISQVKFQCLNVGRYMSGVSGTDHDGTYTFLV